VEYLSICNLIKGETADGKTTYTKTLMGQKLHEVLKDHGYLGPLMGDLSRNRRRAK